jgi:signal transduction histidine kinase
VSGSLATWYGRWRYSLAHDIGQAAIVTVTLLAGSYYEAHPSSPDDKSISGHHVPYTPGAALLLVVAACVVLAAKRRYPLTVLAISTGAVVTYSALGYVNGAVLLAPAIALYMVAQAVPVRQALLAAVVTLVALGAATIAANPFGALGGGALLIPALVAAPVLAGIAIENGRAYLASIAEQDARRRVDEERLRIARELHDVVAHTMATINVQAGVAAHVLADNPGAVSDALQAIKRSSKDGLRELRAILDVLRQADGDGDAGEPTQPTPGLADLDALIAGAASAGLPATLSLTGAPWPLPTAVDLAAYRIVQESLTNVMKHAGPATATVSLSYDDAALRIEVTDTGIGSAAWPLTAGPGHGLIGMRERAASVGGSLEAGPRPEGGYRVAAVLPVESAPDEAISGGASEVAGPASVAGQHEASESAAAARAGRTPS